MHLCFYFAFYTFAFHLALLCFIFDFYCSPSRFHLHFYFLFYHLLPHLAFHFYLSLALHFPLSPFTFHSHLYSSFSTCGFYFTFTSYFLFVTLHSHVYFWLFTFTFLSIPRSSPLPHAHPVRIRGPPTAYTKSPADDWPAGCSARQPGQLAGTLPTTEAFPHYAVLEVRGRQEKRDIIGRGLKAFAERVLRVQQNIPAAYGVCATCWGSCSAAPRTSPIFKSPEYSVFTPVNSPPSPPLIPENHVFEHFGFRTIFPGK